VINSQVWVHPAWLMIKEARESERPEMAFALFNNKTRLGGFSTGPTQ
jgi:hypothetical protein